MIKIKIQVAHLKIGTLYLFNFVGPSMLPLENFLQSTGLEIKTATIQTSDRIDHQDNLQVMQNIVWNCPKLVSFFDYRHRTSVI